MSPLSYLCADCNILKPHWQYFDFEHEANDQQPKRCDTCCKKKCSTCNEFRNEFHFSTEEWTKKDSNALCFPCYREDDTRMMPYFYCSYCKDLLQAKYFVSPVRGEHNGVCYPCMTREQRHAQRRNFTLSPHLYDSFDQINKHMTCRQCHRTKDISHFSKKKGLKQHLCLDCLPVVTCRNCNMEKPPSQYTTDEPLCSTCLPKTAIICSRCKLEKPPSSTEEGKKNNICNTCILLSIEDLSSPGSQINQDGLTTKCWDCNIEKTCDEFQTGEWKKKNSRCRACVEAQMKKCLDCNIQKERCEFSRKEWKTENSKCRACVEVQTQMKKCLDCNIEKHRADFYKKQWKKGSRCIVCVKTKVKKCFGCNIEKVHSAFFRRELITENSRCIICIADDLKCPNVEAGSVANISCMMCKKALPEKEFNETEIYKPKSSRMCKECSQEPSKPPSSDQGNGILNDLKHTSKSTQSLVTPEPKYTSLSQDKGVNKDLKENLALSHLDIKSKVLFSMNEETRKRPREDLNDAEIGQAPKVMKQNTCSEEADNKNISSSTSHGLAIGDNLQLVLFRSKKESIWWPALASTSIKKIIIAAKLDTKVKFQILKMKRDFLKSNKQQGHELIYVVQFQSQYHPEDQQPMHIISKYQQHDLVCDFFDQSFVCENEEGPRGKAVNVAISWGCDSKDDTNELMEHNNYVGNKALQKRVDEAEVQIRNQNERLKKLEEGKNENWNNTDKLKMNLMKLEEEKNEWMKKTEDMKEHLRRLEEEKNECTKKSEDTMEELRRLEQENNDYKMKAEKQSKNIQQLEEEKTFLKQKTEEQHSSIKKLTGLQDLSNGLKAELECPICFDPLDNPYMNPECAHRFCYRCIMKAISQCGKECPLCRVRISSKRVLRKDELIGSITDVVFRDDECIEIK